MFNETLSYLTAIVGIVLIALFVISRNRTPLFKYFFWLSIAIAGWLLFQYLSLLFWNDVPVALGLLRMSVTIANLIPFLFLLFTNAYPNQKLFSGRQQGALLVVPLLFALLSTTEVIIQNITIDPLTRTTILFTGLAYTLQTTFVILYFLAGFYLLIRKLSSHHVNRRFKRLITILLLAFAVPFVVNFIVGYVFINNQALQVLGPLSLLAMNTIIAYAMARHRLFDFRLLLIRSVSYVLLLGVIGLFYVISIFGIGAQVFGNDHLDPYQQLLYIATTLVVATSFQPLKRFFDQLTNQLFFRGAYSSQQVLNRISALIVHTIDIHKLLRESKSILNQAFRAQTFAIILCDKHGELNDSLQHHPSSRHYRQLLKELGNHRDPVIVADELQETTQRRLVEQLLSSKVAVVARLQTSKDFIGYMLLGYKQNGDIYTQQDLDLLKIVTDELAVSIQNGLHFLEIQNFNETLQQKVREATRELRGSNKKLKTLDEAKDDFISMASHQLRTPLTSVKGYLSMVLEGDAGRLGAQQRKLLEEAFASSQRMVYLISDFLNVSRLQTGRFTIEPGTIYLNKVVSDEVNQLQAAAAARELSLEYQPPSSFPALRLDENKIRQVIMNFIDNAIFYSRPGGVIKIDLLKTAKEVVLTVQDQGIGVPASERYHLFSKFYRATNARKVRPDGTGIGIFMAKKVIVAHGGSIIFESKEGKGSTFGFRLPVTGALVQGDEKLSSK